jgi:hypothetical protein
MKEQCEKYGLTYYETAHEREKAFQRLFADFEEGRRNEEN